MLAALLGQLRAFGTRSLDALATDRAGHIAPAVLAELGELGLFGLTVPEAYGGSGLGLAPACAVVSTLAGFDRSVAVTVGLHLGLGSRGLIAFGTQPIKERLLPELATGQRIAAFCATEPGAGSDLTVLQTRLREGSGGLSLTGQKAYVTNGGLAGVLTVVAQSERPADGQRSLALAVVDPKAPGVTVGPEEKKLGLRASSTTPLYFDGVEVAPDAVLGAPSQGSAQLAHILCWGRLLMSAGCVGTARRALELALRHTAERRQFGRPLAAQAVVQQRLGSMAAQLFAMQALVEAAARSPDEATLVRLSTSAKLLCSEGAGTICDLALQLHGGSGYLEDSGLPLLSRDARVTRIFEGANDVLWTHRGMLEAAAPLHAGAASSGKVEQAADGLRRVLLEEMGVRLLGDKEALHRLGQAMVWADASRAARARAQSPEELRLLQAFEATALESVGRVNRAGAQPDRAPEWAAAVSLEWTST